MLFVVEVKNKKGEHVRTYVLEPAPVQFYDVRHLNRNPHYQILPSQLLSLKANARSVGFHCIEEWSDDFSETGVVPDQVLLVMSGNRNYFLSDITVCNEMTKDEIAMYGCIPMTEFGEKMFIHDYCAEGNRADKRGNLRYDAGYTGMNQTDKGVVPGMNFPCRLIGPSRQAGIGDDTTFEHTLYKAGCLVMKLSDSICSRHPEPSTAMGQCAFGDDDRNGLFGVRWAEKLGIQSLQNLSRFDGMSCFGTGETIDYRVIKT